MKGVNHPPDGVLGGQNGTFFDDFSSKCAVFYVKIRRFLTAVEGEFPGNRGGSKMGQKWVKIVKISHFCHFPGPPPGKRKNLSR